jgi:hypothetical protein
MLNKKTNLNSFLKRTNINLTQIFERQKKFYSSKTKEEIVAKIHKHNINTVTLVTFYF